MGKQSTTIGDIGLESLADFRHPPVTERRAIKTGVTIGFGQVVKVGSDGAVEAAASGDTFYGVACETVTQSQDVTHVSVLVHGTVKRSKAKVGSAAVADADVQKLKAAGIYVLN